MLANFSGFQAALIGLAVLVFFIARQFNARRVSSPWMLATPLVLGYFGLLGLGDLDQAGWLLLALNLSLGAGLGFVRGTTFRLWFDEHGDALAQGTVLTLILWLATLGVKIALTIVAPRPFRRHERPVIPTV